MKTHGETLSTLLTERGIDRRDFIHILVERGISDQTAKTFLKKETVEIKAHYLSLICRLFGFVPEQFGHNSDVFTTKYSIAKETEMYSYNFKNEGDKEYRPYIENFFKAINEHLLVAHKKINICEYISRNKGFELRESSKYFHEQALRYYKLLEVALSIKGSLRYNRIAQLPLGCEVTSFEAAVWVYLEEVNIDNLLHLCRCMYEFPYQCNFFIISKPYRTYTYYLVDDYLSMTEYYRFDKNGVSIPDTLFVNTFNPEDKKSTNFRYFSACQTEFETIADTTINKANKLTVNIIRKNLFEFEAYLERSHTHCLNQIDKCTAALFNTIEKFGSQPKAINEKLLELEREEGLLRERLSKLKEKSIAITEIINQPIPPRVK